jgi:hypothetical protein
VRASKILYFQCSVPEFPLFLSPKERLFYFLSIAVAEARAVSATTHLAGLELFKLRFLELLDRCRKWLD